MKVTYVNGGSVVDVNSLPQMLSFNPAKIDAHPSIEMSIEVSQASDGDWFANSLTLRIKPDAPLLDVVRAVAEAHTLPANGESCDPTTELMSDHVAHKIHFD